MKRQSITSILAPLALIAMSPLNAQANPADGEDISYMKTRQTMVEGVVTKMKSGLYTIRTATGTNYTLAESVEVRYGRDLPKVGDEMILWINDGNHIMDANKKGATLSPRFVSGNLVSIDYGRSQIVLSMNAGEETFTMRPESRMFRDMAVGTSVTIAVCKEGEVIDIHADNNHPGNESALVGFRHLGKSE